MQNTHSVYEDYAVCGTRGWLCPGEIGFTVHDDKIYKRELGRLQRSLESAKAAGYTKIIGMIHFPPTNEKLETSGFTDLFESFGAEIVVYGHLHGSEAYANGVQGHFRGVKYILTSCDHLACKPLQLL
jgi:predicted phosphohydrolase